MNLGETIYRLRTEKNLSQGDLADAMDVSRQSVSKWENNSATPDLDKLVKLAQLFGISLDELITGMQKEPAPAQSVQKGISVQQIVGIVLLGCGIIATIFVFFLGIPILLCGILCLTVRRHPGYHCALAVYTCAVLFFLLVIMLRCSGGELNEYVG